MKTTSLARRVPRKIGSDEDDSMAAAGGDNENLGMSIRLATMLRSDLTWQHSGNGALTGRI